MNLSLLALPCLAATTLFAIGCQTHTEPATSDAVTNPAQQDAKAVDNESKDSEEGDVAAALGQLSPEDRTEAEAQKFCAVARTSRLGSMGAPVKLDVKGQSVFLCCAGCESTALKNPDETLAAVAKLKSENRADRE